MTDYTNQITILAR